MKTDLKKLTPYIPFIIVFLIVFVAGMCLIFKSYTITFDLGDDRGVVTEKYNVATGDVTLGIPEREGYRFEGWTGSNGKKPERDVVLPAGTLGNKKYKAHWSDELEVICEDWVVDADGNMITEITDIVDNYLNNEDNKGKHFVERSTTVKKGSTINPGEIWGDSEKVGVYSDRFAYIGNSGETVVEEEGTVVYRYFYPVLAVKYTIDGQGIASVGVKSKDLARYDLYLNGEKVASNTNRFNQGVPYGSWYTLEIVWTAPGYNYVRNGAEYGADITDKREVLLAFSERNGDYEASCKDYLVDAKGEQIKDITKEVDKFLKAGDSYMEYSRMPRKVDVGTGDVVNGANWGCDPAPKAYHSDYCYAGSSGDVTVKDSDIKVERYFYPTLNIRVTVDGVLEGSNPETGGAESDDVEGDDAAAEESQDNEPKTAIFDLYVDGEPYAEKISEFHGGIPYGSTYEIRNAASEKGYFYVPDDKDTGVMGEKPKTLKIEYVTSPPEPVEEVAEEEAGASE